MLQLFLANENRIDQIFPVLPGSNANMEQVLVRPASKTLSGKSTTQPRCDRGAKGLRPGLSELFGLVCPVKAEPWELRAQSSHLGAQAFETEKPFVRGTLAAPPVPPLLLLLPTLRCRVICSR